jgi:hypothetical protein
MVSVLGPGGVLHARGLYRPRGIRSLVGFLCRQPDYGVVLARCVVGHHTNCFV